MARARTAVVVFFLLLFSIQTSNHDAFTIRIKRMVSINRVCNNNNKQGDCGSTRLHAQKSDNYNIIDGKQTKKKKRTLYKVYDRYSNDNDGDGNDDADAALRTVYWSHQSSAPGPQGSHIPCLSS